MENIIEAKEKLEQALVNLIQTRENAFLGRVLQCVNIKFTDQMPTAGIGFNRKTKLFEMFINPTFISKMSTAEAGAILLHECMHVLFGHTGANFEAYDRKRLNIAQDLAINQYIKGLPPGGMHIENFLKADGTPFPKELATQGYYGILTDDCQVKKPGGGTESLKEFEKKINVDPFDIHEAKSVDSDEQKERLEAVKGMIGKVQRDSDSYYSPAPGFVETIIDQIKVQLQKMDYKRLLMRAIRKSLPSANKEHTWSRLNKRYGEYAKGSKNDDLPRVSILVDTSGSISPDEVNEFLGITNNFLLAGCESLELVLFHTNDYFHKKIKRNFKVDNKAFQSGGTDVTSAMKYAMEKHSDLIIMITDGYFGFPDIDKKKIPKNSVFVISKSGTLEHPLSKHGISVKYGS